jgi:hypothetical protein
MYILQGGPGPLLAPLASAPGSMNDTTCSDTMYVIYIINLVDIIKPLKGGISYTAKTNSKTHHGLKLLNDLFDSLPINVFILSVSKKTEKSIKLKKPEKK